ncbi:MAG: DUF2846 domain-containing protein [gamma proteobacterium symbiont of Bathyaustriella thionipta]|nr:DUF2846 domain-containing protein [gamma proteobacterium symbiont of Bathyaustriella thionipta]MCU7950815.1 DUF2846 domain-containing protein [gamma proteobacterium symbiont of Bathyaustriella thionipta]MCU7953375.1 DUF2846 domain-containing protein [gamma proteobacterium symbiont of Bathyaustriella thionipta]MCU7957327.1 DUF2846 domain-containing protein [gamma proteobacterium symbiont of Bathyaustriella thionipta]MCU7967816.1 DUF2846 domain-containing protein [gamma proteobacterium symbion
MKKFIHVIMITLFLFSLSACAPVDYSQEAVFPETKPDQALIYFYRTPGFIGSTYRFNLFENKQVVGAMAQNSYFYLFTSNGEHTYSVGDRNLEKAESITLTVQAGQTYYVKVDIEYEVMGGKPVFTLVDKVQAMKLLPSRVYVVPSKKDPSNYNVHAEQ